MARSPASVPFSEEAMRGRLRALRAKAHIAKKQLGMDDEDYRSFLLRSCGHQSTRSMNTVELVRLIEAFKAAGFKDSKSAKTRTPHARKVWALWLALYDAGAVKTKSCRAFVKRMTGKDDPDFLSPEEARPVIEALKSWGRRDGAESD